MATSGPGPAAASESKGFTQKMLDGIERLGNKVPHPVLMFLYLILIIIVLSHVLYLAGVSVTEQIAVPRAQEVETEYYEDTTAPGVIVPDSPYEDEYEIVEQTVAVESLLTVEGIRFLFSSFVRNFQGFGVVAVTFIAMLGAGVAEGAGMMGALIRKLVQVAPRRWITFIIVFVGVISSIATDAGYLILIPLGAAAFLSLRRHPLAGMAAAFGGVSAAFGVTVLITPIDSMLTEITNEAIGLAGGEPITIVANIFFSIVSSFVLAFAATWVTERIIEPRLGVYEPEAGETVVDPEGAMTAEENRGLKLALYGFLGFLVFVVLLTAPPGAPLREPETGAIIGTTPFMDSLLFLITLAFLIAGIFYGIGAKTIHSANDVINSVVKTFAGLSGLIFMLLMIAQFIAYFNYTNMPTVAAIAMAGALETANIGALPLLIGLILVITLLNVIIPGVVPKWAIFAPVFIPIFLRLGVAPQTVLAAYRVGDSPLNVITPLMVYLPFVVTVAQRYVKNSGLGTIVALMLPYSLMVLAVWVVLFILWFLLGIPLG
ncbi:MAG TPA: AbgT family transporter, partial [Anaerolineales bacterium]|nr:AbgT family transporter [Anaerolineales bacterium]